MSRRLALVALACALLTTACVDLYKFPDADNGRLPEYSLTTITPECQVLNVLARPLREMLAAAKAEGVGLMPEQSSFLPAGVQGPPRIESCYRSFEMQEWWRSYYCSIDKCGNAAVPGTSKHGWGRAVDFQDQNGELTFQSPGFAWLAAHAAEYGFYQPASVQQGSPNEEAWHWEHDVEGAPQT